MAREPRKIGSKRKKDPKRDWTNKVETGKIVLYILEVILVILFVIRNVIDNLDEIHDGYFNLLDILIPISLLIVLIGVEEVLFSTLIGAFRKDLAERFRFLESCKRGAITTAIVSLTLALILMAPPVQDMIQDASGRDLTETSPELFKNFKSKDPLNLTGLDHMFVGTEDNIMFNVTLYRGDTLANGIVEANTTRVREWEYNFDKDDVDEFIILAQPVAATGDLTWNLVMETEVRPELITGIAAPFLVLGILNLAFYALARLWSRSTEDDYLDTQTRKLRARFKIEEAFLIYEDGRLITHNSRRLKPERDKDIMTGMLTAVQSFVTDTLIDEEKGTLDQLKYGSLSILVEGKGRVNLATIISGDESPVLRQGMKNILSYINGQYRHVLEDWDGDIDRFKDVKRYIGHLVSTGQEEAVLPDELFLFHRDGRLVAHQTSRLEPSIDDGLLQNWVDQCVGAVRRSMADPGKSMPTKLNVMGYDVLLEYTNYLNMGFMTTRKDADARREVMSDVLHETDEKFHEILYDWDGATHELADVKTIMESVLAERVVR